MALLAFQAQGFTLVLPSTAASATLMQPSTSGAAQSLRIVNLSTSVTAYVAFGATTATAVAATTAVPAVGHMPILPQQTQVFSVQPNVFVSAITTAGQANLALTPGYGLQ